MESNGNHRTSGILQARKLTRWKTLPAQTLSVRAPVPRLPISDVRTRPIGRYVSWIRTVSADSGLTSASARQEPNARTQKQRVWQWSPLVKTCARQRGSTSVQRFLRPFDAVLVLRVASSGSLWIPAPRVSRVPWVHARSLHRPCLVAQRDSLVRKRVCLPTTLALRNVSTSSRPTLLMPSMPWESAEVLTAVRVVLGN